MKQTAVEWLYNNLKSHFEHNGDLLEVVQMSFEQAKAMEMQQIKNAFQDGANIGYNQDATSEEQYYNEIYVKGDKRE